ncbi:receptor expression-enhancing protein 4-like, partial [Phasianus colchicus]|uniref:receptor expression-enhancing protein 4-like n=1 Tax=Phasianus colchicus TaxID=9054 RepID=UPI00129EFB10
FFNSRLPFYYELKMAFVLWLLSPYTRGAGLLYRSFVHPTLSRNEKEIDLCIVRVREQSYETMLRFGRRGLNMAATAAVQAAAKVGARSCPPPNLGSLMVTLGAPPP